MLRCVRFRPHLTICALLLGGTVVLVAGAAGAATITIEYTVNVIASSSPSVATGMRSGVFTYEVAETKVTQVVDYARKHQHPLQCTLERE